MARIISLQGLTFDDVLLVPAYSEILPREVNVHSRFTRGIELAIPLVSAAMDTVTEYRMAANIASLGGIGVIHKNMSIADQTLQVQRVKESGLPTIAPVIHASGDSELGQLMQIKDFNKMAGVIIDEVPVLKFISSSQLDSYTGQGIKMGTIKNWQPVVKVSELESIAKIAEQASCNPDHCIGLVNYQNRITGIYKPEHTLKKTYHRATIDDRGQLRVAAAIGVTKNSVERGDALVTAGVDALVVDTAHGHSAGVLKTVKLMRAHYGDVQMIAGNIATTSAAEALAGTGVDGIKVGIGPGSICTTRIVAGVGIPQLTAIMEVARSAGPADLPVIADGGIRRSGDVAKALAAGADSVMLGGIFAGTEESPGEIIEESGRRFKSYRGMGSIGAMVRGSKDRYFQESQVESKKLVAEGVEGYVPLQGSVKDIVFQLIGGVKSAMGYCGAKDLHAFKEIAEFIQVTPTSIQESHPHDLYYVKEAPNYKPST